MGDRRHVQQQIGGAAEGRVDDHGVFDRGVGEDVVRANVELMQAQDGAGGAAGGVEPDGLARRGEGGVRQGTGPRASAMTCAVAAVPRNWQPPPGVAQARQPISAAYSRVICFWAKRAPMVWTLPASSPFLGQQRDATGDEDGGQGAGGSQSHHHGGQALVAGGDADHAASWWAASA